jgi:hypothetical protein
MEVKGGGGLLVGDVGISRGFIFTRPATEYPRNRPCEWHHFLPTQVGILWRIKEYWSVPVATSMFQMILLKAEVMTRKLKSFGNPLI